MKSRNQLLTYLFAIAGGVLLLIFNSDPRLYGTIVITIGVLFLVASGYQLIQAFVPARGKKENGAVRVAVLLPAVAGVIFGLLLVCMPNFFVQFLVFTFAIMLFILGLLQLISICSRMKTLGLSAWLLTVPILTIVAGVVCLLLNRQEFHGAMTVISGIVLVIYGINGFVGYVRARKNAVVIESATVSEVGEPARSEPAPIESKKDDEQ